MLFIKKYNSVHSCVILMVKTPTFNVVKEIHFCLLVDVSKEDWFITLYHLKRNTIKVGFDGGGCIIVGSMIHGIVSLFLGVYGKYNI